MESRSPVLESQFLAAIVSCGIAAQLLLHKLSGGLDDIDFLGLASESRQKNLARNDGITQQIKENRKPDTPHQPLPSYVGRYWNEAGSFFIQISLSEDERGLAICFMGEDWDTYQLRHFDGETFEWHITREEQAKRARWPRMNINFWKYKFHVTDATTTDRPPAVTALTWVVDPFVPAGNVFTKEDTAEDAAVPTEKTDLDGSHPPRENL